MRQGLSLIEATMSLILVAIISLVIAAYIGESVSSWSFTAGRRTLAVAGWAALHRIDRELKLYPFTNITTYSATRLTIKDLNNNPVTFSQEGTTLRRNNDILLDNLLTNGLTFTYLTSVETVATNLSDIRIVRTQLSLSRNGIQYIIESSTRQRLGRI